MKIIQIMPEFGLAGAETMCENLAHELKKSKQEIIVVSLYNYKSAITERLEDDNIPVIYLDKKRGIDITIFLKLYKLFKKEKPDIVHTHLYSMKYAIPAAIFARTKGRIHTIHNIAQKENNKIDRKLNKLFYKFAKVVPVALSTEIQKTVIQEYKLKKKQVPIIFNGINLDKCIEKVDYNIDGNIKILHIGRFSQQKNHFALIEAYDKFHNNYNNSELNFIGTGELEDKVKKLVVEKKINNCVNFLGTQKNVYKYLNNADVFILPSLYEGIPMSLIEAMGTGIPIIASNVGGIPDMLSNNEEALLINSNTEEIYKALCKLIKDVELRKRLGTNAKEKSQKFAAKKMSDEYIKIYKKIINDWRKDENI